MPKPETITATFTAAEIERILAARAIDNHGAWWRGYEIIEVDGMPPDFKGVTITVVRDADGRDV